MNMNKFESPSSAWLSTFRLKAWRLYKTFLDYAGDVGQDGSKHETAIAFLAMLGDVSDLEELDRKDAFLAEISRVETKHGYRMVFSDCGVLVERLESEERVDSGRANG